MAVSVEYGAQKSILFLFSILIIALAIYPIILPQYPEIQIFDPAFTYYFIGAVGVIQLIFIFRMKRPRIF